MSTNGSRGSRAIRRDAVRNRAALLVAAGELLRTDPLMATMPEIAGRAGLSVATAYRYFPSIEDLHSAYLIDVMVQLRNFSHDCSSTGTALFVEVVTEWVRLVQLNGPATVQIRSRRGFLARLKDSDLNIMTVREAWERPIRAVIRHFEIPDEHFSHALFLYNLMFDPREVLDLLETGLTEQEVIHNLVNAYFGAVRGWAGQA